MISELWRELKGEGKQRAHADRVLQRLIDEGERLRKGTTRFLQQVDEANMAIRKCDCPSMGATDGYPCKVCGGVSDEDFQYRIEAAVCCCQNPKFIRSLSTAEVRCDHCSGVPSSDRLETIMPGVAKAAVTAADPDALPVGARTEMEFIEDLNPLCIWRLRDGSIIKSRVVLMHCERVEGCFNPDGSPMYSLGWQQVLYVVAPDELKRPQS